MFSVKCYQPEFKPQWDQFIERSKNGFFMFRRDYMDYHADRFSDHSLCFFRDDVLFALMPASAHEHELVSHGGLTFGGILSDDRMKTPYMLEIFDTLMNYLRTEGFISCLYKTVPYIYHRHPAQEDKYALFRHGATLKKCEITSSICRAQPIDYSERRRRGIKKAHKLDMRFERSEDYAGYFALVGDILQDKYDTQPTHSAEEMALLAGRFPQNIALWTTRSAQQALLAGIIMYVDAQVAHAQYIAASPEGKESGALDALFDHLIREVYNSQPYFDFGISTEQGGKHLNLGLVTQKEEFGARAIAHETYTLTL